MGKLYCGKPCGQFKSIALITYGKPGTVMLGDRISEDGITLMHLKQYPEMLELFKFLSAYVVETGHIDMLGCDIAQDPTLIQYLTVETKRTWRASTNKTGSKQDGGDWVMETDEKKRDVSSLYFEEDDLKRWTHHLGFFSWLGNTVGKWADGLFN